MNALQCVGNTPLIHLEKLSRECGAHLHIKLEMRNPGGSIKDRAARAYIDDAFARGLLAPGGTVVEATSGNLGIGLAFVCAALDLRLVLTMPASASRERMILLRGMGAELILTDAALGMRGALDRAGEILRSTPGAFQPSQFDNPAGPAAHYAATGPEIAAACREQGFEPAAFAAGVGSGATLCGTAKYLKEQYPALRAFAVEPAESPLLSGGTAGPHGIQGIGANFVPGVYDPSVADGVLDIPTADARETARLLLRREGVNAGISSGANLRAAMLLAARAEFRGKHIVTIACDTGERYLSTDLFPHETDGAAS